MTCRHIITVLSLVACAACSDDEPAGPAGPIDFHGAWSGRMGESSVQWTATHQRNSLTGPIVVPSLDLTGTLSGTVVGDHIEFTLTFPFGSFPSPVSSACRLTGTGITSTATRAYMVIDMLLTFTEPCIGTVTSSVSATSQVVLTKSD